MHGQIRTKYLRSCHELQECNEKLARQLEAIRYRKIKKIREKILLGDLSRKQ